MGDEPMKDWKVVTFDTVTRAPKHEEWDTVAQGPIAGTVMVELHEGELSKLKCIKRRYYPLLSIIYIEENGLESSS